MKIHIKCCDSRPDAKRGQATHLRRQWELSDRQHELVEDANTADIIFLTDVLSDQRFAALRKDNWITKHVGKSFLLFDMDLPVPLLRGICASGHRKLITSFRFRTGSYSLYPRPLKNPYAEKSKGIAFEQNKEYLASFRGRDSSSIRRALLRWHFSRPDISVTDTSHFDIFKGSEPANDKLQSEYVSVIGRSKFSLCPRGNGTGSMRLFESMQLGVAPVILSDDWIKPAGPCWDDFSISIAENQISSLEAKLTANEKRYAEMGRLAAEAFNQFFADEAYFNFLVQEAVDIYSSQVIPENFFWALRNVTVMFWTHWQNRVRDNGEVSRYLHRVQPQD